MVDHVLQHVPEDRLADIAIEHPVVDDAVQALLPHAVEDAADVGFEAGPFRPQRLDVREQVGRKQARRRVSVPPRTPRPLGGVDMRQDIQRPGFEPVLVGRVLVGLVARTAGVTGAVKAGGAAGLYAATWTDVGPLH